MTSHTVERHPLKEKRRANKPLLERKRRARINDSLGDLKYLVLTSMNKDVSKYTKMEKVDILDMTVRYLKGQQRSADYSSIYRAAYTDVCQHILSMDGLDNKHKHIITSNLANTHHQREMDKPSPPPSPTLSSESLSPSASPLKAFVHHAASTYEHCNYTRPTHVSSERHGILSKDFLPYPPRPTVTTIHHPSIHHLPPPPIRHMGVLPPTSFKPSSTSTLSTSQVWRPW